MCKSQKLKQKRAKYFKWKLGNGWFPKNSSNDSKWWPTRSASNKLIKKFTWSINTKNWKIKKCKEEEKRRNGKGNETIEHTFNILCATLKGASTTKKQHIWIHYELQKGLKKSKKMFKVQILVKAVLIIIWCIFFMNKISV